MVDLKRVFRDATPQERAQQTLDTPAFRELTKQIFLAMDSLKINEATFSKEGMKLVADLVMDSPEPENIEHNRGVRGGSTP